MYTNIEKANELKDAWQKRINAEQIEYDHAKKMIRIAKVSKVLAIILPIGLLLLLLALGVDTEAPLLLIPILFIVAYVFQKVEEKKKNNKSGSAKDYVDELIEPLYRLQFQNYSEDNNFQDKLSFYFKFKKKENPIYLRGISATYNDHDFLASTLNIQVEKKKALTNEVKEVYSSFDGFALETSAAKVINGTVWIIKGWGLPFEKPRDEIKLDDPRFNKIFRVYADDPNEAFSILPLRKLDKLVQLSSDYRMEAIVWSEDRIRLFFNNVTYGNINALGLFFNDRGPSAYSVEYAEEKAKEMAAPLINALNLFDSFIQNDTI